MKFAKHRIRVVLGSESPDEAPFSESLDNTDSTSQRSTSFHQDLLSVRKQKCALTSSLPSPNKPIIACHIVGIAHRDYLPKNFSANDMRNAVWFRDDFHKLFDAFKV